jgi:hypothetical protein
MCDQETSCDEEAIARAGLQSQRKIKYSLAKEFVFKLIKPGYMFQLYSHYQTLTTIFNTYYLHALKPWSQPCIFCHIMALMIFDQNKKTSDFRVIEDVIPCSRPTAEAV